MSDAKWTIDETGRWVCPQCKAHVVSIPEHKCPEWMRLLNIIKGNK